MTPSDGSQEFTEEQLKRMSAATKRLKEEREAGLLRSHKAYARKRANE